MKTLIMLAAAGTMAAMTAPASAATLPAAPAPLAGNLISYGFDNASPFTQVAEYDRRDYRRDRREDRREWQRERRLSRNDRVWRGNDGRYRCERNDGTTGLVIGAVGGALAGRAVDTRGDRTVGTLLGAVGGGLLGREIDRGGARCR
jgi:uncharacterized protein YcfJ